MTLRPLAGVLLDERSSPSVRQMIGTLLARAVEADFAIARIRLGAVDLSANELAAVRRCRVLVARLDVQSLAASASADGTRVDTLLAFLRSRRVEVRSAGSGGWATDFSIFRGLPRAAPLPDGAACLVGAHTFWLPQHADGPTFTSVLGSSGAVACASRRFEELWVRGYDVLPVLLQTLETLGPPVPGTQLRTPVPLDGPS